MCNRNGSVLILTVYFDIENLLIYNKSFGVNGNHSRHSTSTRKRKLLAGRTTLGLHCSSEQSAGADLCIIPTFNGTDVAAYVAYNASS